MTFSICTLLCPPSFVFITLAVVNIFFTLNLLSLIASSQLPPSLLSIITSFLPESAPSPPTGVSVTNIHPHSVGLSWSAQSGVASYTVQYTQIQGASQLGECKNSTHSGSVSTTSASPSITVQGSGDDMVRAFTTYSITVTAVSATSFLGSSAPSAAVFVTTAQTGSTYLVYIILDGITFNIIFFAKYCTDTNIYFCL